MNPVADETDLEQLLARRRGGFSLERAFYTSEVVFQRDIERVFFRDWLFAGHQSQLPNPGDFLTFELAQESIVITRGEDGQLHAMFNVCRHRGSRIVDAPCGNAKAMVCPYHRWVYGLDGSLRATPHMRDGEIDKSQFGLRPVRLEVWNGLIYIHLSEDDPKRTVADMLAPATEALKRHELHHAKVAHTITYDVPANWKLFMENYRECYHCHGAHPQFCATVPVDELDQHRGEESQRLVKRPNVTFTRYSLRPHAVTQSIDGTPVSRPFGNLTPNDRAIYGLCFYPGHAMVTGMDYAMAFSLRPVDATHSKLVAHWLVQGDAREGVDYRPADLAAFWDVTNRQDVELCGRNQLGVNSRQYLPGPYSKAQEDDVEHYVNYYIGRLGRKSES